MTHMGFALRVSAVTLLLITAYTCSAPTYTMQPERLEKAK